MCFGSFFRTLAVNSVSDFFFSLHTHIFSQESTIFSESQISSWQFLLIKWECSHLAGSWPKFSSHEADSAHGKLKQINYFFNINTAWDKGLPEFPGQADLPKGQTHHHEVARCRQVIKKNIKKFTASLSLDSILWNGFIFSINQQRSMSYHPWSFDQYYVYKECAFWLTAFLAISQWEHLMFTQQTETVQSFLS